MIRLALFAGIAAAPFLLAAPAYADAYADAEACAALAGSTAFTDTTIERAEWVESGSLLPPMADIPSFCEVWGTIRPVEGSRIGVVYRLPGADFWNGKLLGLGGGGWSGNTAAQTANDGLGRGYATMQTDTGHPVPEGFAAFADDWVLDENNEPRWAALEDFAHRGLHLMTVTGKEVARAWYGRAHDAAYYQGCSTGGRQGLMEAQRYPLDYDAIIAGAPVLDMTVQSSHMVRSNLFSQDPRRALSRDQLQTVAGAAMARCDPQDGVTDGVISHPFACDFDPAALACPDDGAAAGCLSPEQVFAMQTMYEGVKTADGIVVAHRLPAGSELGWTESDGAGTAFEVAQAPSVAVFTGEYGYDALAASPDDLAERVLGSRFGGMQDANDPDISGFVANGGKLIVYHGLIDTIANPGGPILWYEDVMDTMGEGVRDNARLFLAPGMNHCAGGPGPNAADWLTALETWAERGEAPDAIVAIRNSGGFGPQPALPLPEMLRPLCPYPLQQTYDGAGDPNQPESFSCQ